MKNLLTLPDNLPIPEDDGACDHLEGMKIPELKVLSINGSEVDLSSEDGISVIYFYPMIGNPNTGPMVGWNDIPGARGCTPQSCEFRDHFSDLKNIGITNVFGVSSQNIEEQKEASERLHLPFELLNDSRFEIADILKLPTFEYNDKKLIKRLTLIIEKGEILKVFYPVFPPNENASHVIEWLKENKA
ncbi:MAG: peroxiredoxin [Thiohalomonadales bacterium]